METQFLSEPTVTIDHDQLQSQLESVRQHTLSLVSQLSKQELECVHSDLMSPLIWDLGHIATYEDLWINHRLGGYELLKQQTAAIYDAFENPRDSRGELPYLRTGDCLSYLDKVRRRTLQTTQRTGPTLLHQLVISHEQQHAETLLQTLEIAGLKAPSHWPTGSNRTSDNTADGLKLVEFEGGDFTLGNRHEEFCYDNERPAHPITVSPFSIAEGPVTNLQYMEFIEAGGYRQRNWWSQQGWEWLQTQVHHLPNHWEDLTAACGINGERKLNPHAPVVHVSKFEAEAFANSQGLRLPTEIEWEFAAKNSAALTAETGQQSYGPNPVIKDNSESKLYGMVGSVWEWTSSEFDGYPGFTVFPYKEYSEAFFKQGYYVLRGGSWATATEVATATFRNWDLPQRKQIFSGFRVAR